MNSRAGCRLALVFALAVGARSTFAADKPETPHLVFVTEYVHDLASIEDIRAAGERELKQDTKDAEKFATAVHNSTLFQLELRSQIRSLQAMRLNSPFEDLIPNITALYVDKIVLHQNLIDISSAFIAGPEPGVDYGKLAAELPKVRAKLEYIDHTLFQATPSVFATLIDEKPDSKNHASHLRITKAERAKLLDEITRDFGAKLNHKEQNWTVSSASVLKTLLLKDYKCSDEPWE